LGQSVNRCEEALCSRFRKNLARKLSHNSYKSAFTGSICKSGATVGEVFERAAVVFPKNVQVRICASDRNYCRYRCNTARKTKNGNPFLAIFLPRRCNIKTPSTVQTLTGRERVVCCQ